MKKIIVIGGGAAGLMAAISAADQGGEVVLVEKMASLGRKLAITGKGRCNITNDCDIKTMISHIPGNGSFLYGAFHTFFQEDIIAWLNAQGVATKVERGGRVFPVSDEAKDVVAAFSLGLLERKVKVLYNQSAKAILTENGVVTAVETDKGLLKADAVILATGGASYPGTGSSGDGYAMAKKLGHTLVPLRPSLVPLEVEEDWIGDLQGLSLRNVKASLIVKEQKVGEEFGEMLFAHYGLTGPIILSLSRLLTAWLDERQQVTEEVAIEINLKPALSEEVLDKRLQRDFEKFSRRQLKNSLSELLPAKMIPVVIDLAHLDPEKFVHQVTKAERQRLQHQLQHLSFFIRGTRPLREAIVTAGGVATKEINPKTMESKIVQGLFLAGEVIDI
ncbi:MAG: NAD(P)/FAD-dependent oxidoreductase, partial [Sporomusaceae bacterium]|nr:NAD(P)/FAD-dependent oxidoreductase [Sporomusaceae bacterium]